MTQAVQQLLPKLQPLQVRFCRVFTPSPSELELLHRRQLLRSLSLPGKQYITLTPGLLISLVNTGKESLESLRGRHFRRAGPPGLKCTSTSIYIIHLVAVYSRVSIIVSYSTPYASMESSSWTCPFAGLLTEVENNPSVPSQATPDIPKSGGDEGLMRPTIAVSSLHPFAVFSPPLLTPTGPFNI